MVFELENSIFEQHRATWLKQKHEGKFAVIKGDKVLALQSSLEEAYKVGLHTFGDKFLVREIKKPGDDVQVIHRVNWSRPNLVP